MTQVLECCHIAMLDLAVFTLLTSLWWYTHKSHTIFIDLTQHTTVAAAEPDDNRHGFSLR